MGRIASFGVILVVVAVLSHPLYAQDGGGAEAPQDWQAVARQAIAESGCAAELDHISAWIDEGAKLALVVLGEKYESGFRCVRKDPARAAELYRLAVDNSLEVAYPLLGYLYLNGLGVPRDAGQARYWFKRTVLSLARSAEEERSEWLRNVLGHRGIPEELQKELLWINEVENADAHRKYNLALRLRNGIGLPEDRETAHRWLFEAAVKGHPAAAYELARWHISGAYGDKDVERGLSWLTRAARAGHAEAQKELGLRYAEGRGVEQNNLKGYYWLLHARQQGADVAEALDRLDTVISPDDRDTANWLLERGISVPP